ncbi:MAG: ATP-dependent RecD-like DNA helicase [Victivallaceae bacterium]|nr:ATP-dependent RecD-like DNA helicase [Victivallaceae bacterium]
MDTVQPKNNGLATHTLRGEITRVVYENDEGDFSIVRLADAQGVEHTVVGNFSGAFEGQSLEVTGRFENHKEFGVQLRAEHFRFLLPGTREGIIRYLSSGMIEGIGPKNAENIVNHFGDKTLEILDHYSARLKEVPGIGKKRAAQISEAWKAQSSRREIFIFLQGLGISSLYCQKLYKEYGDKAAEIVKSNPFRLADEIEGIGFLMADNIASSLGIAKIDLQRLAAGTLYTLNQLTIAGHCCYPVKDFVAKCAETLRVEQETAAKGLEEAEMRGFIRIEKDMAYPVSLYRAETELPRYIYGLGSCREHSGLKTVKVPPLKNLRLSEEQTLAVERAGRYPLNIITGGPGVGKTTVIHEIVRRALAAKLKVYQAAPTGRAAKRMSEAANFPAKTIHRMLKWEPAERKFAYNAEHKLPCDVLIVDEISMLDLPLALCLFRAVNFGTSVILVGDADQLPSVGPGKVLDSFLKSGMFAVTKLTKIFRQGAGSRIISNAHRVNHGELPEKIGNTDTLSDFYWIEQDDPDKVLELIVRLQTERIPKRFGFDPVRDIQVLTPMNRGNCGTHSINDCLQHILNSGHKPQFKVGDRIFKAGDRVMQISNNYDKNIFNGDMGRIGNIDHEEKIFSVFYGGSQVVNYEFTEVDQLTLAYAVTIHKSQGSEFPAVIMPMLNQHYMMLQRNLLYTGITRAQKLLILIGGAKAVAMAVRNTRLEPRYSLLRQRLVAIRKGKKFNVL